LAKQLQRTPKNYDGTRVTTRKMSDLLSAVLEKIGENYKEHPDLILAAWPAIVGPQIASMTQAMSFNDGVLIVKVKNSTLHHLLSQKDRYRILNTLRMKFPKVSINNILFRIG
jgi:predicted nucleic acid-binding Zn ribbon protein